MGLGAKSGSPIFSHIKNIIFTSSNDVSNFAGF